MLKTIRQITARKIVERRHPTFALGIEVARELGMTEEELTAQAEALQLAGKITIGRTFNDVYYKLTNSEI